MGQILGSVSDKVCSAPSPKFVTIDPFSLILENPPSSANALLLCHDEIKYWLSTFETVPVQK